MTVLKRTRRGYEEPGPPPQCPQGHALRGRGRVLVGTQQCTSCSNSDLGPHRSYTCQLCWETVYDPLPRSDCTFVAFDGRPIRASSGRQGVGE